MITRRGFVAVGAAAALNASGTPLRLGGPIFLKSDDPAALAKEHRRLGYTAAYVPPVKPGDGAAIEAIRKAFAAEEVVIAEVGAWRNMMDRDAVKRKDNIAYVIERMALAEAVGALNCVNISGSMHPQQWDGPDLGNYSKEFFDATIENCRAVIDAVKPKRAKFSIEMMPWAIPDSADAYVRLFKAVDRPAFGVHIDVCNIVNSVERFFHNGHMITECFQKLGRWVVSCHAKDIAAARVHLAETVPGRGGLDYRAYLRGIESYSPRAPLMLEHLRTAEEYDEGKRFILKVAADTGVRFMA